VRPRPKSRPRPRKPKATRVIAVANQKGGVGKSTTAVSLGAALAELGYRVLVVDLDPQGNASTGLGIRHESRDVTVYDVLATEAPIDGAVVATPVEGLFAIPSTIDLAGAEIELVSQFSRELRLRKALEPLKGDEYDFVFLDCPPSLGLLTVNALAAAQELIVPIQCEYYALEGLGQLLRNVGLVQQNVNPDLRLTGIVMTMYDPRTKLSEQVVQEVRRHFGKRVYRTVIPRTVRLSEAPGFGQPITVYDPRSRGAECYRDLAKEVASKLPLDQPLPSFNEIPRVSVPPPEPQPMHAPRPLRGGEDLGPEPEPVEPAPEEVLEEHAVAPAPEFASDEKPAEAEPPPSDPASAETTEEDPVPEARTVAEPVRLEGPVETPALAVEPTPSVAEPGVEPVAPPVTEPAEAELASPAAAPAAEERAPVVDEPNTQAEPVASVSPQPPDADGSEAWIAAVEAEARPEGDAGPRPVEPPPVREIDLEPEREPEPTLDPESVIRIEDRDAAGDHETRDRDTGGDEVEGSGRRRWSLFRRGGSR
jgi:chromosome partitioning protein